MCFCIKRDRSELMDVFNILHNNPVSLDYTQRSPSSTLNNLDLAITNRSLKLHVSTVPKLATPRLALYIA